MNTLFNIGKTCILTAGIVLLSKWAETAISAGSPIDYKLIIGCICIALYVTINDLIDRR